MIDGIYMETRRRTPIANAQDYELPGDVEAQFAALLDRYRKVPEVRRINAPSPYYNCHGLVFASRRTKIVEHSVVQTILRDDGYDVVPRRENVRPGDVILYFDQRQQIQHTALALSKGHAHDLSKPIVLSKWGNFGEVQHPLYQCPYHDPNGDVQFYRVKHGQSLDETAQDERVTPALIQLA